MELILKSDNQNSIKKVIALAKKLHITVEERGTKPKEEYHKDILKERILNFNATAISSFGDAEDWQNTERKDRNLLFNKDSDFI